MNPLQKRFVAHAKPGCLERKRVVDFRNNHNDTHTHGENVPKISSTLTNRDKLYTSLLIRFASRND